MTPSAQTAGGRRVRRWTRELIIEKIREWDARYGEPPCSADWNPSLARWRAQEWRAERYREGVWPSTNAAKRPFGGSFDAAVRAAGLEPRRPGPKRAAHAARPAVEPRPADARLIADVDARVRAADDQADAAVRDAAEARAAAAAAERRVRELSALVAGRQTRLTAGELAALRSDGLSGPAVLAGALRRLAKARASGDRRALRSALGEVASAAVRWHDRL
jgi:hypothetical protein